MVKISNPFEENNNSNKNKQDTHKLEVSLTPTTIKKMLKPVNKQSTTPVNLRLETSIADQIKIYANEHDTTMTEVIKDIITEYYFNKKITRGSFKIKEPVNLIIPKSMELVKEYVENEVNIVSSIKQYDDHTTINPLDPQNNLYNNSNSGYEIITVTQANNILDVYNEEDNCYSFMSEYEFYEDPVITEDLEDEIYKNSSHRGLLIVTIKDTLTETINSLLIDVLTFGNKLTHALIITPERAIELARITGNMELISFIKNIEDYSNIWELVSYDNTNKELTKENHEIKQIMSNLIDENESLKLENESLTEEIKETFLEVKDNEYNTYVELIEKENKKLKNELKTLELKEKARVSDMEDILNKIRELQEHLKNNRP